MGLSVHVLPGTLVLRVKHLLISVTITLVKAAAHV